MTQTIINLGTGGALLNGQNGSTASADTNDALFLDWPGANAGNYFYVADAIGNRWGNGTETSTDITGDLELICHMSRETPLGTSQVILSQGSGNTTNYNWRVLWNSLNQLALTIYDGTAVRAAISTAAIPYSAGEVFWWKITKNAATREVDFYTSDDGASWTQLGSTVTMATSATGASATGLFIGARLSSQVTLQMQFYRLIVKDGIAGTTVMDIDTSLITSGSATELTARTGQTISLSRATSGRKSVAVVSPVWLFGTDDYMEVSDNTLLDFGAINSFTVIAVHRVWDTQATNRTLLAKKADTTDTTRGWSVSNGSTTALEGQAQIGDGVAGVTAVSAARTAGALSVTAAVRDVDASTLTVYLNGVADTPVTDTTADLSNAEVMRIARLSGAGTEYADMELIGVAVFRRVLTASEVAQVTDYYQARLS
jgi:hypothetical protein